MATETPSEGRSGLSLSSVKVLESPEDWLQWYQEIRDFLIIGGYNDILTRDRDQAPARAAGVTVAAHAARVEAWNDKQERACAAIRNRFGYNARALIEGTATAAEASAFLESNFKQQAFGVFTELCRRFYELTLSDCKDVSEYTEKFCKVRNELLSLHPTLALPEPFVVQKFLHGLGPAYNIFQSTFNQTHDILPVTAAAERPASTPVTFNVTSLAALNEERRLANQGDGVPAARGFVATPKSNSSEALITVKNCIGCDKNYHTIDECWEKHPHLKKPKKTTRPTKKRKASDEDGADSAPATPMSFMTIGKTSIDLPNVWIIDTGCSQYVTCRRGELTDYKELPNHQPVGGIGGVELKAMGRGSVSLACSVKGRRTTIVLKNIIYCPDISVNLISVSQLLKKGATVTFDSLGCRVQPENQANYVTGVGQEGLFLLILWKPAASLQALAAYSLSEPRLGLWHEHMAHLGEQNLRKLMHMATGADLSVSTQNSCTCEPCVMGRMKKTPHTSSIIPGTAPLGLVYMNVCGPFSVTGAKGERYWASYIDSYTQISDAIPIKHKSEAFT
jgi:hypothetical protein